MGHSLYSIPTELRSVFYDLHPFCLFYLGYTRKLILVFIHIHIRQSTPQICFSHYCYDSKRSTTVLMDTIYTYLSHTLCRRLATIRL